VALGLHGPIVDVEVGAGLSILQTENRFWFLSMMEAMNRLRSSSTVDIQLVNLFESMLLMWVMTVAGVAEHNKITNPNCQFHENELYSIATTFSTSSHTLAIPVIH